MGSILTFGVTVSRSQLDIGGGGGGGAHIHIHIFVFTDHKNDRFQKEIDCAEHEYMNMSPPPPIIELATALWGAWGC